MLPPGAPFLHEVMFESGFPGSNIVWTLVETGATGTITPTAGSVSAVITIPGNQNTLPNGALFAPRTLTWQYSVSGQPVYGRVSYRVEAALPYGAGPQGVRSKLGVAPHELPDVDIDMLRALGTFTSRVGSALPAPTGGLTDILARDGIEATAALELLPTLSLRVATRESSGTDQYQRGTPDYEALAGQLTAYVESAFEALIEGYDPLPTEGDIFSFATRTDAVTGS